MKDRNISIPFKLKTITCVHCDMEYSILGVIEKMDGWCEPYTQWYIQDCDYCPYCGKKAKR